jgi:hypothetical protein
VEEKNGMNRDSHKSPRGREGRTGKNRDTHNSRSRRYNPAAPGQTWAGVARRFGLNQDLIATLDGLVDSLFIASNSAGATKREINWWLGFG